MTHTVHPYAHRLGIIRDWRSRWFPAGKKQYRDALKIDNRIRAFLKKRLRGAYVANVEIERGTKELRIIIETSRPGIIIGRSGEGATKLNRELRDLVKKESSSTSIPEVKVDVVEVKSPESRAAIVAYMIAEGLEKRLQFRRVMKQTADKVMANRDVQGVRIMVSGRLGGADMKRKEEVKKGRIPLQTFRADIDFAHEEAYLPYGVIGIKVWIYRGEIFSDKEAK
jgi:small subunit ribosomal protein S3